MSVHEYPKLIKMAKYMAILNGIVLLMMFSLLILFEGKYSNSATTGVFHAIFMTSILSIGPFMLLSGFLNDHQEWPYWCIVVSMPISFTILSYLLILLIYEIIRYGTIR